MRIGFDLDGVVYPWHEVLYNHVKENKLKGYDMSYDEYWMRAPVEFSQMYWDFVKDIVPLYDKRPMTIEIENFLLKLQEDGHSIYFVTQRDASKLTLVTETWLNRTKLEDYELYFVERKDISSVLLNLDIFVEDRISNVKQLRKVATTFLVTHPFNIGCEIEGVFRIPHVTDLAIYLEMVK